MSYTIKKRYMFMIFIIILLIMVISTQYKSLLNYSNSRNKNWIQDISYLEEYLPKNHVNLYFKLSQKEFKNKIKLLKNNVYKLNDDEIMIELMKIIASIGDEHTIIDSSTNKIFPVKFYWFNDGIYVIDTIQPYNKIMKCKLTKINGIDINKILSNTRDLIAHSNEQWIKSNTPYIINSPNLLYGMGIATTKDKVTYTFTNTNNETFNLDISSILIDEVNLIDKYRQDVPLYRKNVNSYYWYEYLPEYNVIYYKHDILMEQENNPFTDFSINLFDCIKKNNINKLIIDLRNNSGGDTKYINNIIDKINLTAPEINKKDKLYIIIGRDTFSSAILNCIYAEKNSNVIFVGEPTGGKPNGYGSIQFMELPNSKIKLQYSIVKFNDYDKEVDTFIPDINVTISSNDYFENRDTILDTILKRK